MSAGYYEVLKRSRNLTEKYDDTRVDPYMILSMKSVTMRYKSCQIRKEVGVWK